jgi:UDP-GlcNAc3NAcA epimerase
MHIKVAHVEAGLRSNNMEMPEEINRIVADRLSDYLFCPTKTSLENLKKEGIRSGVYNVGDVMFDATVYFNKRAKKQINLSKFGLFKGSYALCTIHRAENTDNIHKLESIFEALREISLMMSVVLPLHPRTKNQIKKLKKEKWLENLIIIKPVSYLEMLFLESSSRVILTDSGGVQKEAYFHRVPCITLRSETEWVETVSIGCNFIAGSDKVTILESFDKALDSKITNSELGIYGEGNAAGKIVQIINQI